MSKTSRTGPRKGPAKGRARVTSGAATRSPAPARRAPVGDAAAPSRSPAFSIVGIGASAGGLDAFKRLLAAMPVNTGMAFVLVPHLDPTHESLMVELLSKQTAMPVSEIRDGTPVESNHVYIIPPNADIAIADGVLQIVAPPPRRGTHTAIDAFLQSLAVDQRAWAIGIILSGTGSHGALGVRAIHAGGGMVLAQTPDSAEHDQMPRGAIATGVVDGILPPEQMGQALLRFANQSPLRLVDAGQPDVEAILLLLRSEMRLDFRMYRRNMLLRRVTRRMGLCRVEDVSSYVSYLRARPDEVRALGKDLLIGVTAFFREPEAFGVLERIVIPEVIQRDHRVGVAERPVRVWVPGCATGEEAYSLAILLCEQLSAAGRPCHIQMFATDLDEEALEIARAGLYPASIANEVSADRLQRFFIKTEQGGYQVARALREVITFAAQNLIGDAPFSKLDLISCRNVLIYLEPQVQAKVIALLHFALLDGGYLLLGPAESIGSAAGLFAIVSKKWRVYRRAGKGNGRVVEVPILPVDEPRAIVHRERHARSSTDVADLMHRALLEDFSPAAVLINQRYEILSVQGPVVEYLEFPAGELTRDLLSMARSGLRTAIRGVCQEALRTHQPATDVEVRVKRQQAYVACTVSARLVTGTKSPDIVLLVTFRDRSIDRATSPAGVIAAGRKSAVELSLVRQMERELKATREDLQSTIEDLESSNEDLKASHEEVMSVNEELQSTNEELETSKEELQSLNEELSAVNAQLQDKVHELDATHNDMVNLLASTEIATVFLDADLRIKSFTPPTGKLLNLLPTDVGRPFRDIALRVTDTALLDDCRTVLEHLAPVDAVLRADEAHAYLRRVLPYRTADNRIDGVVITWVDVTRRLATEAHSRQLSAVLRDSNDAVVLLDLAGRVIGWNRGAEALYGYSEAEALTLSLRDLAPAAHRDAMLDLVRRLARGDVISESVDTPRHARDGRTLHVSVTMTLLRDGAGRPDTIVTTERDLTTMREGLAAQEAAVLYQQVIEYLPAGAVLREGSRITMNLAAEAITGYPRAALATVDAWWSALHGNQAGALRQRYQVGPMPGMIVRSGPLAITRMDGTAREVELSICRLDATRELWLMLDISERHEAERALRQSESALQSIVTTALVAIITIGEHGTIETFNPAAERMFGYTAAEAVGQNVNMLMPPPYHDEHDGYIAQYLRTHQARVIGIGREVIGLRKDRTTFPVELAVSELDHQRRFTGILRDVSDRWKLEWRLAESQVEERRYMAQELHDEIGGHMTGIGLLAQTLHTQLTKADSPLASRTEDLVDSIKETQQRLRSVIRGLMPVDAVPEGLMAALQELAKQSAIVSKIPCRFECEPPVHVDDSATTLHLFRIAQEAVNNAVRHAAPASIIIQLRQTSQHLEIAVVDDGGGMKDLPEARPGIGLDSMRQRARLLGGDVSVQARPSGGTIVACWVPLPVSNAPLTDVRSGRSM